PPPLHAQVNNELSKLWDGYHDAHTKENVSGYSNKKFRQYIDTYCGNPSKSFIKKATQIIITSGK
ncbi:hypothetical protein, partial [Streptococcus pneumoniae]|uniref:hypothetical protein n=1 Tax=Streptococcus pneumoniae TaxID=1313 RepID=UPI001953E9A5